MLKRLWQSLQGPTPPRPRIVVGPEKPVVVRPSAPLVIGPAAVMVVQPSAPLLVQPPPRGAWLEKGWSRECKLGSETFTGRYAVFDRHTRQELHFRGRIEAAGQEIVPFVSSPPPGLSTHPKGVCFSHVGQGWFRVHWHRPPHNVDDAILYIERVLDEVVNRRLL